MSDAHGSYDIIIIGSGAGGGTLAYALRDSGTRILVIERGDFLPQEPENWDEVAVIGRRRYQADETWFDADTGRGFRPGVYYFVGGCTKMYGAAFPRFRREDFLALEHEEGVSPAWPIAYEDLEPYYGLNNPVKYRDPSGHAPEDALAFLAGVAYGWAKANREGIPIPISDAERQIMHNIESLAVDYQSFSEGRIAGGVIAVVQGAAEAGAGGTTVGGGVLACATGVGCVAGAPAMALGAAGVYHGSATALSGAGDAAQQLALFAKRGDWTVGEPINKGDPSWEVARSRYWQNRAQNAGGEFSRQNIGLMKKGFAPKASVRVRWRGSGIEEIITVEKELHHINGGNIPDPHNPSNLMEVWPWEHEGLDPSRNTGYDFLGFK